MTPSSALKLLALSLLPALALARTAATARDDADSPDGLDYDPIDYVDQLIGSSNGGNVFPGATVPYGMAKAVADTTSGSNQGGFTLDGSPVSGFSVLHDSGTGGSPSLGNFPLFAYAACPDGDVNRCDFPKKTRAGHGSFSKDSVVAEPGYFAITLDGAAGPAVEMTATHHAALFNFSFPGAKPGDKPLILQDLSDLSDSRQDNGSVTVDPETGRIRGRAVFVSSFSQGTYTAYFCTDFKGPQLADAGVFVDSRASTEVHELTASRSINGYPLPAGAFVRFADGRTPVLARVGVSMMSEAQACASAEAEMPDFDLARHRREARDAWRAKLAGVRVDAAGVDASHVRNLYSGIYRTMVSPQNYTGENPLWRDDAEPYYFDSFYCIWDLFRSQLPFLTIVDPAAVAQMVRSLIATYEHEGWLPDCRMSLSRGYTQGGSNADNVLADAFLKGVGRGGGGGGGEVAVDWDKGYAAVKKDAEVEPFDWCCHGRGGLDSWDALGYVPVQDFDHRGFGTLTRSLSRTLEYAYNDFAIAQMAGGMGREEDRERFLRASGNWERLWRADQGSRYANGTDTGFTGFFQPRYANGTWGYQDPLKCSNLDGKSVCSLQNNGPETFESSIWEYGFFVPHDQASLIALLGGPDAFCRRLDYLHDAGITYIGNEPAFLTVFQYHYAGRPALSARRAHFYIPRFFQPTPPGLPGNDDSGAMGSFLAFAMLGLFPNPGQDVYLITPPFFRSVAVTHPLTGRTARVRNVNFDPAYDAVYIQSATLDGRPYTRNWIDHSFFTEGKELVLTLGRNESAWGTAVADLPPSLGKYAGFNQTYSRRWAAPGGGQAVYEQYTM